MKIKVWLMVLLLALLPLQGWAQEETDYEQIYQGVLEQFYSLLTEGGEELEGIGGAIGVMELTWMFGEAENGLEDIGYCITDVNGDGIEELLIGQTAWERSAYLCAVYTCVDGRAVCALESWARSRFFLMEDGRFYYEGSQGAAQSGAAAKRPGSAGKQKGAQGYDGNRNQRESAQGEQLQNNAQQRHRGRRIRRR